MALLGCAPRPPQHPFELTPGRGDGSSARRLLLAPMNALQPLPAAELSAGAGRVFAQVQDYLAESEKSVALLEGGKLQRAALRGSRNAGPLSVTLSDLHPAAVRELLGEGEDPPFDALVLPDIVIRQAELEGRFARWDGVKRQHPSSFGMTWSGNTSAASLRVRIFAADGERVFEGFGGLDLLFRPVISERRMEPMENLLSDQWNLRQGVAVAFHPYLELRR